MDFPAIEKCYTHVSYQAQNRDSLTDSEGSSPISPVLPESKFDLLGAPLTPVATQSRPPLSRNLSRFTIHGTTNTTDPSFEVEWEDDDPNNPRNWSTVYKSLTLCFISISTFIVVLYSTAYMSAIGSIMEEFGVHDKATVTLGLTTYLLGLAAGSVFLAPLSETFGRKPVYVVTMFIFTILVIPCALAKNVTTLIVVRFFGALAGSSMIANAPGSIGDIISEEYRSIAFSVWSVAPMNSPVIGPIFGGFVTEYLGWRWLHWIVLILGGVAFLMMAFVKETYSPVLLQRKAKKTRQETGENRYWSRFDIKVGFWELMKVNLSRPFVMAVTEPICMFWNLYIGLIYGILYLCFASYPIVFHEKRGWSIGQSSLAFLGIGVGNMITICCAGPIKKVSGLHKRDTTGRLPPEIMMSVVCVAAVLVPIGELWFAWTCLPASIHPAISIAAGIPFGMGNGAIFIYASNYLVASYGIYAASAMAGNSVIRSVLGGVLPLAGASLYETLGANRASTLLGLLEVIIIPIPFVFYRYGHKIRQKSTLISEMREIEEKQERKKLRAGEKAARALQMDVVVSPPAMIISEKTVEIVSKAVTASDETIVEVGSLEKDQLAAAQLSRVKGFASEVCQKV